MELFLAPGDRRRRRAVTGRSIARIRCNSLGHLAGIGGRDCWRDARACTVDLLRAAETEDGPLAHAIVRVVLNAVSDTGSDSAARALGSHGLGRGGMKTLGGNRRG